MMAWLQDPWVVGVGAGIISGLVVFFITKWLFSNQGKRELSRKIATANQEIVLAVRQGIPEDTVPTANVLEALVKATARKHGLRSEELYGPGEVAQDLIKEVMDSSFISAETKENYCKRLAELDAKATATEQQSPEIMADARRWTATRSSQVAFMSLALALTAGAMSIALVLVSTLYGTGEFDPEGPPAILAILLPVVATLVAAVLSLVVATLRRVRKRSLFDNLSMLSAIQNRQRVSELNDDKKP